MLTAVATLCVRTGKKVSVPVAQLSTFSALKPAPMILTVTRTGHDPQQRSLRLLLPTVPQLLPRGTTVRRASGSAFTQQLEAEPTQSASSAPEQSEVFGALSSDMSSRRSFRKSSPAVQELRDREHSPWEEKEEVEGMAVERPGRRNTQYWYFLQCKKLVKDNKLQDALQLFSRDMLQVEKLQPEEYNYTILIGGCGRSGQLKTAFKLYNDMKKRGLEPVDATYTALFNACAESKSKAAGLQRALHLEQELRRKNYQLSTITYHALLKTHAVTNHLQACMHTFKEMLQNGHVVTQETFHYLLMGCLQDKANGFRLALQVWQQMVKSGIRPDSKNYTLLLRTARDCGIGDPALASHLLLTTEAKTDQVSGLKSDTARKNVIDIELLEQQLFIEAVSHRDRGESVSRSESSALVPISPTQTLPLPEGIRDSSAPNLLDLFEGRKSSVMSLGAVNTASDRLALIGGAEGFLAKLEASGFTPDLRTLTLLADIKEPSQQSLQILLKVAKQHCVKLDTAFFNSVIRKSARAGDLQTAKSVLSVMRQRHVSVDVQTFGSLALGCVQQKDGLQLLKDMQEAGFRPNVQVFSAMIGRATRRQDYVYLRTILRTMREMEVWPNEVIIRQLEFAAQYPPNYNQYKSRNNYLVQFDGFRGYYQHWLKSMPALDDGENQAEVHSDTELAVLKPEAPDTMMLPEKNQRAAARRFKPRKKDKMTSTLY